MIILLILIENVEKCIAFSFFKTEFATNKFNYKNRSRFDPWCSISVKRLVNGNEMCICYTPVLRLRYEFFKDNFIQCSLCAICLNLESKL